MDSYIIKIQRVDPGATVEENGFNSTAPDTDITRVTEAMACVVRTTPAHLLFLMRYAAKLNLGYATNLTTLETAVTNLTA